jgi:hypothetical protein
MAARKPTRTKRPSKRTLLKKRTAKKPAAKAAAKVAAKRRIATKPAKKSAPKAVRKPARKRAVEKPEPKVRATRPTPARDARTTLAQKRAISATLSPVDGKVVVDAYLRDVDHPFKAEMQAVRQIILAASPKISERIKWNAPSFHYKEDLGAFNPRATEYAHLILLFPDGKGIPADDRWLEGKHKDRREAKFYGLDDIARKKPALEKLVKRWVALRDA